MSQDLLAALDTIEKEKGVNKEILFEAIEVALMSAYKRNFNHPTTNAVVEINRETGAFKVFRSYEVVESVEDEFTEISLDKARHTNPDIETGETIDIEVTPRDFGRIAAQTAKQVVIQRIREAERDIVYEDYIDRVEELVTGLVQRFEQKNVIIDLGKAEAILPYSEQIPQEKYRQGERIKIFIMEVKKTSKGPQIVVSRSHPGLLKRLFEMEVPEIFDGIIKIKAVAREAGHRSKIAVATENRDIDPVGACVGPKGSRVQSITQELKGEKIDIVHWSEEPEIFIKNALSPAKASYVKVNTMEKVAQVIVPDSQLSLSIGREGQNARLAARITNWKVDIVSESQIAEKQDPLLSMFPEAEKDENDIKAELFISSNNNNEASVTDEENEDSEKKDNIDEKGE